MTNFYDFRVSGLDGSQDILASAHRHALYVWLTAKENGFPGDIGWNFEKFLIDRDGRVICRYPSGAKPTDPTFLQDLADVL